MGKLIIFLAILFAFYKYIFYIPELHDSSGLSPSYDDTISVNNSTDLSNEEIQNKSYTIYKNNSPQIAFDNHFSHVQINGAGTVYKILRDDNEGRRHQKFILRLPWGQTLLVAHNIDIAPRLNGIQEGDKIEFQGQYEWNSKGGVLHWTHHDPSGRHQSGWLKYGESIYQ